VNWLDLKEEFFVQKEFIFEAKNLRFLINFIFLILELKQKMSLFQEI
jgi:hypothetical protein